MSAGGAASGKAKASDISLQSTGAGVHFSQNNVTDPAWGEAYDRQFQSEFASLSPEGQAYLNSFAGQSWSSGRPDSSQNLVSQHIAPLLAKAKTLGASGAAAADIGAARTDDAGGGTSNDAGGVAVSGNQAADRAGGVSRTGSQVDQMSRRPPRRKGQARDILG